MKTSLAAGIALTTLFSAAAVNTYRHMERSETLYQRLQASREPSLKYQSDADIARHKLVDRCIAKDLNRNVARLENDPGFAILVTMDCDARF